jgi:hypothetical protein
MLMNPRPSENRFCLLEKESIVQEHRGKEHTGENQRHEHEIYEIIILLSLCHIYYIRRLTGSTFLVPSLN